MKFVIWENNHHLEIFGMQNTNETQIKGGFCWQVFIYNNSAACSRL